MTKEEFDKISTLFYEYENTLPQGISADYTSVVKTMYHLAVLKRQATIQEELEKIMGIKNDK